MFSWEIDCHDRVFNTFYEFNKMIESSPQVQYTVEREDDDNYYYHAWSNDGYEWNFAIKKEKNWLS